MVEIPFTDALNLLNDLPRQICEHYRLHSFLEEEMAK